MQRLPANFRFQFCLFVGAFVHTIRCAAFVPSTITSTVHFSILTRTTGPPASDSFSSRYALRDCLVFCVGSPRFPTKKLKRTGTPLNYSTPAFPFITRSIFAQVLRLQNLQRTVTLLKLSNSVLPSALHKVIKCLPKIKRFLYVRAAYCLLSLDICDSPRSFYRAGFRPRRKLIAADGCIKCVLSIFFHRAELPNFCRR